MIQFAGILFRLCLGALMVRLNATKETFDLIEIAGYTALFSDLRIDRESVPEGVYAYDVRHCDEGWGEAAEIKEFVLVNHMGTILSNKCIDWGEDGYLILEKDFEYLDERMTLREYQKSQSVEDQEIRLEM